MNKFFDWLENSPDLYWYLMVLGIIAYPIIVLYI